MMARRFRIHPAIGVARVGNSPDAFFIGPEHPSIPANWGDASFESFRDDQGRIKRQAARFRVYEYVDDGTAKMVSREIAVGGDILDIEWRVHVANRKGSFFTFNGQSGAADLYEERAQQAADAVEKPEEPVRFNLRNPSVPTERRTELEIDPGEKVISSSSPGPVLLTNPNPSVQFIPSLGEIRRDEAGHLLFLGGHGISGSTTTPAVEIDEYANNDTWFDDVSDGSVKARIRLADGSSIDADAAWVIVCPPDFAPSVGNAVSLYDLLWDLAVRRLPLPSGPLFPREELEQLLGQKRAWLATGEQSLAGYVPSFTGEIYPILARALAVRHLHEPPDKDKGTYHKQLLDWQSLATKGEGDPIGPDPATIREYVFNRLRNPSGDKIDWSGMPRGLGDNYDLLEESPVPPTSLFSLTHIQYALLEQWKLGNFVADWPGTEPSIPTRNTVTPVGLDRAALENCVGGPFFPGIEVSWLIREISLYTEPFRLNVSSSPTQASDTPTQIGALTFRPGFFSQQMAQPWQADFYDCHKEEHEGGDQKLYFYMWWTAQRPDDVYPPGGDSQLPWARHLVPNGMTFDDFQGDNERFRQMQQRWHELPFIVPANGRLEEER